MYVCNQCGSSHLTTPVGYRLPQCLTCHVATDSPAYIPDDWQFFDSGPDGTFDRYSIWQGDGYLGCSADPFHPQGFGQHCEGVHPAAFGDELEDRIGEEVDFSELPAKVREAVLQDAAHYNPDIEE